MNKRGNALGVLVVLLLLVAVAGGGYIAYKQGLFGAGIGQAGVGSGQITSTTSGTVINTVNPTIAAAITDRQVGGTTIGSSAGSQYSVNGGNWGAVTLGTTTAVPGQTIDLLIVNGSTYHSAYYGKAISNDGNVRQVDLSGNPIMNSISVTSSTFPISVKLNRNASVTETVFNTNGVATANGVGVTNQTDNGNGASYTLKDAMVGTALRSTQDMTCVIELTAGVNASVTPPGVSLSLNGATIPAKSTSIPNWYSPVGVNSRVWLFDIAPIASSAEVDYYINLNALSTGRFLATSRMIKTCYTKEYFVDPNTGLVTYDVANSNNQIQSIASYTDTMYFQ